MIHFLDPDWDSEGALDEPCTASVHYKSKVQPKATHYHTTQHHWLCFTCAQSENRYAVQHKAKVPCITGAEKTYRTLMESA